MGEAREKMANITTNIGVTSKQGGYLKQGKQDDKYTKVHEKDQQEVKPADKVKLRSPKMVDRPEEESRGVEKVELKSTKIGQTKKEDDSNKFEFQLKKTKQHEKANQEKSKEKEDNKQEKITLNKPRIQMEDTTTEPKSMQKKPKRGEEITQEVTKKETKHDLKTSSKRERELDGNKEIVEGPKTEQNQFKKSKEVEVTDDETAKSKSPTRFEQYKQFDTREDSSASEEYRPKPTKKNYRDEVVAPKEYESAQNKTKEPVYKKDNRDEVYVS